MKFLWIMWFQLLEHIKTFWDFLAFFLMKERFKMTVDQLKKIGFVGNLLRSHMERGLSWFFMGIKFFNHPLQVIMISMIKVWSFTLKTKNKKKFDDYFTIIISAKKNITKREKNLMIKTLVRIKKYQ